MDTYPGHDDFSLPKQTGNFETLRQAIEEFSADATRFSLADAGDGVDDANFVSDMANAAIWRLTKELSWMEEVVAAESSLRSGPRSTYADLVFADKINIAIKMTGEHYEVCMFREALKTGIHDLQAARDEYRFSCGTGMNRDLVWRFMDVQTRLIAPVCPHYAEYVWRELLKRDDGFVIKAGWPVVDSPDLTALETADKYLQDSILLMRQQLAWGSKIGNKKRAAAAAAASTTEEKKKLKGLVYVTEEFVGWKAECLRILQQKYDHVSRSFAPDSEIIEALRQRRLDEPCPNFQMVQTMCLPFLKFKKYEAIAFGVRALNLRLPFGEMEVLRANSDSIRRQIGLEEMEVLSAADPGSIAKAGTLAPLLNLIHPSPGNPTAIFIPV